ncbi:hypothetical protein [Pseudomonas asiatica]|uniref:hypothetical protein n=1 Tax=Pseudomonas asiatica TaxID=2219225 RepID=UPI0018ABF436|nr:hypothetical protein [Pseudomonas asiatica]MBF8802266.1 hypothetical protein [Pseudomonas asiatica]
MSDSIQLNQMRQAFERTNTRDHRRQPPKGNNYIDPMAQADWESFQKGWLASQLAGNSQSHDDIPASGRAILEERKRQTETEGWTAEHDDQYGSLELIEAATCYALAPPWLDIWDDEKQAMKKWQPTCPPAWPWALSWWKPRSRRENLIRAGALILAEIERIDRATAKQEES